VIRVLVPLIELALLVYCLIDCIQTDSAQVRNLPKMMWVVLIIFLPLIGSIAWLVAGRPGRASGQPASRWGPPPGPRPSAPRGPDDDPDFLRRLGPHPPQDRTNTPKPQDGDPPAGDERP